MNLIINLVAAVAVLVCRLGSGLLRVEEAWREGVSRALRG